MIFNFTVDLPNPCKSFCINYNSYLLAKFTLPHKIMLKMRCLHVGFAEKKRMKILHCTDSYIRPVINLKPLNLTEKFQMIETLHSIDCFVKL